MNFPSWVFPDVAQRELLLGNCSAIGYDGAEMVIENSPHAKHSIDRYLYRILPPTMTRPPIIKKSSTKDRLQDVATEMALTLNEPDTHLLAQEIGTGITYEQNSIKYERFQGNTLCSFHACLDFVALPRNRSTVEIYSTPKMELELSKAFQLPISQIQYSDRKGRHLLVRTMEGIHALDIDRNEAVKIVQDIEPMHVATSSLLPLFAVVNGDGTIKLWDMNCLTSITGPLEHNGPDLRQKRRVCEFGPHPKSLLVGEHLGISLIDLRAKNTKLLFPFNGLNSLKLSPANQFHLAATSKSYTILADCRYLKSPMLTWELNDSRESQLFLEYHSEPHVFYTFGRLFGEVLEYAYRFGNDTPPLAYRPFKLPSFYHHKSLIYSTDGPVFMGEDAYLRQHSHNLDIPPYPNLTGVTNVNNEYYIHTGVESLFVISAVKDDSRNCPDNFDFVDLKYMKYKYGLVRNPPSEPELIAEYKSTAVQDVTRIGSESKWDDSIIGGAAPLDIPITLYAPFSDKPIELCAASTHIYNEWSKEVVSAKPKGLQFLRTPLKTPKLERSTAFMASSDRTNTMTSSNLKSDDTTNTPAVIADLPTSNTRPIVTMSTSISGNLQPDSSKPKKRKSGF
jgi:hypothetical protein